MLKVKFAWMILALIVALAPTTAGAQAITACTMTPTSVTLCPGDTWTPTVTATTPNDGSATDAILGLSLDGIILGVNPVSFFPPQPLQSVSYEQLLGTLPGAVVGSTVSTDIYFYLTPSTYGALLCSSTATIGDPSTSPCSDLIDTDTIYEPFVQLNDRPVSKSQGPVDTFTIRGRVYFNEGEDPVGSALANGASATVYETGSVSGSFVGYDQVDTFTWQASQCKSTNAGRSVYCKDDASGSFLRLRGTQSKPTSLRVNALVKRRDFIPGKPFNVPLAGEIALPGSPTNFDWDGYPDAKYCNVSHNGERTTCRQPKAGPG